MKTRHLKVVPSARGRKRAAPEHDGRPKLATAGAVLTVAYGLGDALLVAQDAHEQGTRRAKARKECWWYITRLESSGLRVWLLSRAGDVLAFTREKVPRRTVAWIFVCAARVLTTAELARRLTAASGALLQQVWTPLGSAGLMVPVRDWGQVRPRPERVLRLLRGGAETRCRTGAPQA